ncbi:MAG: isoleucine--tRNA ligase [Chlamydiae bacterium]|nr:isoleucine--tRNA ligase [Chlamydiota bacterium]
MFDIQKESFADQEKVILEFWKKERIFRKSIENRENAPLFRSYDGPPFATGLPHYGHILAGTIKDVVLRYKTQKGYKVPRRFGWDCHGLPIENMIEKEKGLSGAQSIEEYGIAKFNEDCRDSVLRYVNEWKATVDRMGRFVDFDETYKTMDLSYMESVWWVFGELWKKGLVYEGYKVMPVSPQMGTPLSNFEANLNYHTDTDPSLTVKFELKKGLYLLVWTTTPWTLVSNLAIAVSPQIEYVKVRFNDELYILAKSRVGVYFKEEPEIVQTMKGKELVGLAYEPLFDHMKKEAPKKAFHILAGEFVTDADGTGLVHMAPAFGEDDFEVCKQNGIDPICYVDQHCCFTKQVPEYQGKFVKDADKDIIRRLKARDLVFHHATIQHRYPHCWRTDGPLIYKVVNTLFVAVEKIKDRLIDANQEIHWVPEHIKDGRFGKWLENAKDWAISRNRFWGTPIPVWKSEDGDVIVIKSIEELEEYTGVKVSDIHRQFVDHLEITKKGKVYKRISEVFDCWFESGSAPYAQDHFPFENKDLVMKNFPADFIAEGLDQTRGWFYTLTVLAAALYNKPAFKNCIVNGIVLAEDGQKMSKRLKNYPDPTEVFDKYGADAVRLYLMHSPVVYADDLNFSEKGVEGVLRQFLIPLWNSYVFLATYANIYQWKPKEIAKELPKADIDRWILSRMQHLIKNVEKAMDGYLLSEAVEPFVDFIDELTNWYIRRNRGRFWADEDTPSRREAFETLYRVMMDLVKLAACFVPFLAERIYLQLRTDQMPESVHLTDFPKYNKDLFDEELEEEMALTKIVVGLGHFLRKENKCRVRQPLACAHIVCSDWSKIDVLKRQKALVLDELNVKDVVFHLDEKDFVDYHCKPNFRVLGKKVGSKMNIVKNIVENFDRSIAMKFLNDESYEIVVDGERIELTTDDVTVERKEKAGLVASSEGSITVSLDLSLNDDLIYEGLAREIINKINTMRKNFDFAVTDRIHVELFGPKEVETAYKIHKELINKEVLALSFTFGSAKEGSEWDLNGQIAKILVKKA